MNTTSRYQKRRLLVYVKASDGELIEQLANEGDSSQARIVRQLITQGLKEIRAAQQ